MKTLILLIALPLLILVNALFVPHDGQERETDASVRVDVQKTLEELIAEEDTDGDKKITIDDPRIAGTVRGDKKFWLASGAGRFEVGGTYYLSNLLQELKLAEGSGNAKGIISFGRIFEPPAGRISRMIREYYWNGLTRKIDAEGLPGILHDEKSAAAGGVRYIYVPAGDKRALQYFPSIVRAHPQWRGEVVRLPEKVTPQYVRSLEGRHGIVTLALEKESKGKTAGVPFVVPGGRFNEMYGWDSYFITLGLLQDGKTELAKAIVDNFIYEIEQYGKIMNANRTYYLTRSQPPFFTSMLTAVYERLPKGKETTAWLARGLNAAIREYHDVWMNADRLTSTGLSRYYDSGTGQPPEVEPGHFDPVYRRYGKKYPMELTLFEQAYRNGSLKVKELDDYFVHDRAMRESGHDTSNRLEGRCADLVTVDLNSLLYKIETDIATIIDREFNGTFRMKRGTDEQSKEWEERAAERKELIARYLWNGPERMYSDYNVKEREHTRYVSATCFYPLWAKLATKDEAELVVTNVLPLLEMAGGIAGSTEESRGPVTAERPQRQWDYPNGWAPHQMLVWQGLLNYGYTKEAERLIYRWLYTVTINAANYNGTIPEKFDVVTRSHQVFAEYGNVGTKFSYITREGFGWTNASYQVGLSLLPKELIDKLNQLIPPEWIFAQVEKQ